MWTFVRYVQRVPIWRGNDGIFSLPQCVMMYLSSWHMIIHWCHEALSSHCLAIGCTFHRMVAGMLRTNIHIHWLPVDLFIQHLHFQWGNTKLYERHRFEGISGHQKRAMVRWWGIYRPFKIMPIIVELRYPEQDWYTLFRFTFFVACTKLLVSYHFPVCFSKNLNLYCIII